MNISQKGSSMKMDPSQATRCLWSSVWVAGSGEYLFQLIALCLKPLVSAGRHLADAALWIAITSILATFSVHKALDEHGEEIPVVPKFSTGLAVFAECLPSLWISQLISFYFSHPETFPYRIVPRFPDASERLTQLTGLGPSVKSN
jgi:hypothetical protein